MNNEPTEKKNVIYNATHRHDAHYSQTHAHSQLSKNPHLLTFNTGHHSHHKHAHTQRIQPKTYRKQDNKKKRVLLIARVSAV